MIINRHGYYCAHAPSGFRPWLDAGGVARKLRDHALFPIHYSSRRRGEVNAPFIRIRQRERSNHIRRPIGKELLDVVHACPLKKKTNIIHTKKSCLSLSPLFVFTMISGECRPERVCCDPHSTECSSSSGTTEDRSLESDPDSLSSHSERRWRPAYVITQEEEEMGIIWQECRHHLRMQAERITQKTDAMASRETGMK